MSDELHALLATDRDVDLLQCRQPGVRHGV
jgi:hypothetical protein